jgi:hypothetical protein
MLEQALLKKARKEYNMLNRKFIQVLDTTSLRKFF